MADDQTPRERKPDTAAGPVLRPDADTPGARLRAAWSRLWKDDRPAVAVPRDVAVVVVVLGLLLGGLWTYTGQPFPATSPVVVVESGSMMHPESPYGHVGTIDPGDLVLVKQASTRREIETAYGPSDRTGYGGIGDVIVYRPLGQQDRTPIIHRAMTWVDVETTGTDADGTPVRTYTYYDDKGQLHANEDSVTLRTIGIVEQRFPASGFVTKGDNPRTNRMADQISHIQGRLVEPDWIIGKARGEIPWLGLVKLSLTGNPQPRAVEAEGQCAIMRAWAPCDAWVMLGASFAALIVVPLGLDLAAKRSVAFRRWLGSKE